MLRTLTEMVQLKIENETAQICLVTVVGAAARTY